MRAAVVDLQFQDLSPLPLKHYHWNIGFVAHEGYVVLHLPLGLGWTPHSYPPTRVLRPAQLHRLDPLVVERVRLGGDEEANLRELRPDSTHFPS